MAACLLAAGLLTLWMPGLWPAAVIQSALLVTVLLFATIHAARRGRWRFPALLIPLALIPLWIAVQLLAGWTLDPWATTGKLVEWTVTFSVVFLLAHAPTPARERLLTALLVFSTLLAAQALLQTFTASGKVFWLYDSGYPDNVLGPFVYHNKYAQFIELVFPLALWRGLTRRREAPLWFVAAAIMFAGVVAGASRSGFAILLLELLAVLLLAWRRDALSGRATLLASLQAVVILGVWGGIAGWSALWTRLTGIDPLSDLRWPLMRSTWEMFLAHPFTGVGVGAWPAVYPEFARFDSGLFANQAHCDWLQWLAEGGVPMLGLAAAFAVLAWRGLVRSVWGIGFIAVCVHALIDYPFHQLPVFTALLYAGAALAVFDAEPEGPRHTSI
jgi:O-antigen ligase